MNILLIGINFGIYETYIKEELERQGNNVSYMHDAPDSYNKLVRVIGKKNSQKINSLYQEKKLEDLDRDYDEVIVIVGRFLTVDFLLKLKKNNQNAKFILYLWDDVDRVENFEKVKKLYDIIYSFDLRDCQKYGFKHLPLFYKETNERKRSYEFDIYSALFNHSDRIEVTKIINEQAILNGLKTQFFVSVGRYDYYFHHSRFVNMNGIEYIASTIPNSQNYLYMSKSNAVLDIQFFSQIGLTMRTIESVGMQNKLITTNQAVKYYDFFNTNNIQLIDRTCPKLDMDFFESKFIPLKEDIYRKYSLHSWVEILTGIKELPNYIGDYNVVDLKF